MKRYPMAVKLAVYITDGEQVGSVSYGFGFGSSPNDEDMVEVIEKVKNALPDGFRLMNRAEATMHYFREERGYRGPNMVIPTTGDWFDPSTDVDFIASDRGDDDWIDDEE